MDGWREICRVDEIPPLGARRIETEAGPVALFRVADGRVFALADCCPHKAGPLSQGIVHGTRVTCPLHDWVIALESGEAVAPDEGKVRAYPVRIEDGAVWLSLSPAADAAPLTAVS